MLNFDREPELLEFWAFDGEGDGEDGEDGDARSWTRRVSTTTRLADAQMQLPSGMLVGARGQGQRRGGGGQRRGTTAPQRKAITTAKEDDAAATESSTVDDTPTDTRVVARRSEAGLIGVSVQQRRALAVTEKKMQKREAVARAATAWVTERVANRQKYYRVC